MIVIMGASGRVGGAALEALAGSGESVRAVCRRPPAAPPAAGHVQWHAADAADGAALAEAFAGARAAFVLNPVAPDADDVHAQADRVSEAVAHALRSAGVAHAVVLSSQGAHLPEGTGIVAALHRFEVRLRAAGVPATVLRPAYFQDSWVPFAQDAVTTGRLAALLDPPGRQIDAVAAADVGRHAAGYLRGRGPAGIVDLVGPRRYGDADAAAIVADIAGRAVVADPVPAGEVAALHEAAGLGASFSREIAGLYAAINGDRIPFAAGSTPVRCPTALATVLRQALGTAAA